MKLFACAFFVLLSIFSHAGEWHSKGNAPVPPHRPSGTANYRCLMTTYTFIGKFGDRGHKAYKVDTERVIRDEEFREPNWGIAGVTLKGEVDPGMDGQSMSLRFSLNQHGEEMLNLTIQTSIEGGSRSFSHFTTPRSTNEISGIADLSVTKPNRQRVNSVRVVVRCSTL
jgi:hypothetical protein